MPSHDRMSLHLERGSQMEKRMMTIGPDNAGFRPSVMTLIGYQEGES